MVNNLSIPILQRQKVYWIAILFSQTLGTALGDWMADTKGLGYKGGALIFSASLAIAAALYFYTKISMTLPPSFIPS